MPLFYALVCFKGSLTELWRSASAAKSRIPLMKNGSPNSFIMKPTGYATLKTLYLYKSYDHVPKIGLMIIRGLRKACNLPKSFPLILDGTRLSFSALVAGIATLLFPSLT